MLVLYRKDTKGGELQIGRPSWDKDDNEQLSVRFAYKRKDGKFARTSPEVPLDKLYEMTQFVGETLNDLLGKVKPGK